MKTVYIGLARTVYDRTFGDFPAKSTEYTPYIYTYMVYICIMANPTHMPSCKKSRSSGHCLHLATEASTNDQRDVQRLDAPYNKQECTTQQVTSRSYIHTLAHVQATTSEWLPDTNSGLPCKHANPPTFEHHPTRSGLAAVHKQLAIVQTHSPLLLHHTTHLGVAAVHK